MENAGESKKCIFHFFPSTRSFRMEISTVALLVVAATSLVLAMLFPRKNHFNPARKHCYIGGGSEGLGLSLAQQLVAKGAHVSIVSRSAEKLKLAIDEIEVGCISPAPLLEGLADSHDLRTEIPRLARAENPIIRLRSHFFP